MINVVTLNIKESETTRSLFFFRSACSQFEATNDYFFAYFPTLYSNYRKFYVDHYIESQTWQVVFPNSTGKKTLKQYDCVRICDIKQMIEK